jgi:hypothetical protein
MRKSNAIFWREAAKSLPANVQSRYAGYFEAAAAWEQALDEAIQLGARVRESLFRRSHTQAA